MCGTQNAGLGRYIEELIVQLQAIDTRNEYIVFLKRDNWDCVAATGRFTKVLADIHWYGFEEQLRFSSIIKYHDIDVMHFPHWNVPLTYTDPYVVTIHDLIMYHYPRREASTLGPLAYWIKDKVMRKVVNHAVDRAKHIIVTSEFTAQDLHTTLRTDRGKMSVVYQAPSTRILSGTDCGSTLADLHINKPFVLYVGNSYPHKNLSGLLGAWKHFVTQYSDAYSLVLAGKENVFYKKLKDAMDPELRGSVIFTDFVSDSEIACLYKKASLFVFPSLYEGFGLPPLEAMRFGVPVVSSNAACMPEILGEGAYYADARDPEAFAQAIHKVLDDKDVRHDLLENAKEELKRYSAERFAAQTLRIYESVYSNL